MKKLSKKDKIIMKKEAKFLNNSFKGMTLVSDAKMRKVFPGRHSN